jgi:mannose-6-phosphate isomerase-like protein (cupin superfamily)
MIGWTADIGQLALDNTDFRRVVTTGRYSQLTLMRIAPGEDSGKEIHLGLDEFIHVRAGTGRLAIGTSSDHVTETYDLLQGLAAFVPGGYWYSITNTGQDDLKLYVLCAPPAHHAGGVYATREDAQRAEEDEELREKLERGFAEAQGFGA